MKYKYKKLILEEGYNASEALLELGIPYVTLVIWIGIIAVIWMKVKG